MTLPVALTGTDVIGQAKTGTGKTLGFGLPLLERVTVPADVEAGRAKPEALTDAPQALVVVPTRELCTQVTNDLLTAGKVRNVRVVAIYGGRAYEPQVEALKNGVDVVVGTPGRLLDLAGQKKLNLKHVKALVLDEADEMLDLGFLPDVEKIIGMLPAKRQTMLFSATMPGAVIGLARRYMSQPTHIRATAPDDEGATVANTTQFIYRAHNMDKPEMVARILQAEGRGLAMIFCRTKRTAADLADQLKQRGFASGAVHGDLGQGAREQALRAFRNGKVDVLVCTDVAARGIDVEGVTHVINYQSPEEEKTYLHRIGRTGRAGAKGTAITLVDWDDIPRWQLINKALDLGFSDPPETYSTSPHLFSDLGIPEGTKGTLPRSERTRAGLDAEVLEDLGETGGRGARGGRGDRDRGGRDRGDRERGGRERGGRDEARSGDREGERSARTPRRRRRTRGGTPLDAAAPSAPAATPAESAVTDEASATRTPRRRRRTRSGAPAQQVAATATTASEPVAEPVAQAVAAVETVAPVESAAEAVEAPAKPRRTRIRRSAQDTAATPVEAPTAAETVTAAPEAEEAAPAPRRTRKAAEAVETAEAVTAEAVEVAPKRTRARKATAAVATPEAAEVAEAAEAAPKRTRKKAAPAAEAVADTVEATEAKPRRTRKTAAATETTEDAEAKPKRTRKTAATAATADEAAEPAPKRTRARKATAAEATAEAGEAAEAAPKRTRKKAAPAAEAAVDTAEATEAKPKRTRKTAATAATAEIPAQATGEPEAKPRRRTRKAAEAVETAEATGEAAEAKPATRRTRKTAAAEA
ncbi:DEAD/DEAH box helicase [Streptomyces sp. BBFR115]|uniref:DEAD/DEAH box helicase n=1 Tax=Streptomyces sp. BBFR115 TaxID=3448173 RepID=UPI003F7660DF